MPEALSLEGKTDFLRIRRPASQGIDTEARFLVMVVSLWRHHRYRDIIGECLCLDVRQCVSTVQRLIDQPNEEQDRKEAA